MVAQLDSEIWNARPRKAIVRLVAWSVFEGRPLTTRGRWINPLVFAGYRLAQIIAFKAANERPIYIVGTGRSGTTLLGRLFTAHRHCIFLNEPKAIWHYAHGGEDLIGSYSRESAKLRLDGSDAAPKMARRIASIYFGIRALAGAKHVVDKYPELVFRVPFVLALFPQAKFVGIYRDGVDTCTSVCAWSRRNGVNMEDERHDWWGADDRKWHILVEQEVPLHADLAPYQHVIAAFADHRDRAAIEWIVSMRALKQAADADTQNFVPLRYEAVCEAPRDMLDGLLDKLGLAHDEVFLSYGEAILEPSPTYGNLELDYRLVDPFRETLVAIGYPDSVNRVKARED